MFRSTVLAALLAASFAVGAMPALAADEHNVSAGLTAAGAPLGLHGVDPVTFVTTGNRIDGNAKFSAVHDGVAYYFASADNLDAFKANPGRFLPQNGGFCTFGVSVGKKFDGDPRWAAVRDGKLYVFLNGEIFAAFQKDPDGVIAKAKANWARIRQTAARDL